MTRKPKSTRREPEPAACEPREEHEPTPLCPLGAPAEVERRGVRAVLQQQPQPGDAHAEQVGLGHAAKVQRFQVLSLDPGIEHDAAP